MKTFPVIILLYLMIISINCEDDPVESGPNDPVAPYTQIDFDPSWSAQNIIAYSHTNVDFDFNGIYVINPNGTNNTQLISGNKESPDWSPDGNWMVFTDGDFIYKGNLQNDSVVLLYSSGQSSLPKWSSDNAAILFMNCSNNDCNLYIMNPEGQNVSLIEQDVNYANWNVGSSSIIFFKPIRNNEGKQTGDSLILLNLPNSSRQVLYVFNSNEHVRNQYPVAMDGEVLFCSFDSASYVYIYKLATNGDIVKLTTTQGYSPDYSPQNQKIVYTNRNQGNGRLWIMGRNGENKVQLTQ